MPGKKNEQYIFWNFSSDHEVAYHSKKESFFSEFVNVSASKENGLLYLTQSYRWLKGRLATISFSQIPKKAQLFLNEKNILVNCN